MAPKTKITVERIQEITDKLKRLKRHQAKRVELPESTEKKKLYRWPSITIADIAKNIPCNADYLVSIKDLEIKQMLVPYGRKMTKEQDNPDNSPGPGSKKDLLRRIGGLNKELEDMKMRFSLVEDCALDLVDLRMSYDQLLSSTSKVVSANKEYKEKVGQLEDENRKLRGDNMKLRFEIDRFRK